jgi:hypothetical protein
MYSLCYASMFVFKSKIWPSSLHLNTITLDIGSLRRIGMTLSYYLGESMIKWYHKKPPQRMVMELKLDK